MPDDRINPYATPSADPDGGRGDAGAWQVRGDALLFRDGARLPEVDVFSGREDLELTPAAAEFAMAPPAAVLLRGLAMGGVFVLIVFEKIDFLSGLLVILLFSMASRFTRLKGARRARLRWYVDRRTALARRRTAGIHSAISWALLALFLIAVASANETLISLGLLALAANLVFLLIIARTRPGFRCVREFDGWFEIRGLPREALRALAAFHRDDPLEEARPRKVFTFHGHRARLSDLMPRRGTNPLVWLNFALLKLTRSRALSRDTLHWSEASDLAGAGWDPNLRRRWDWLRDRPEFTGWRLLHARQLDSLSGDLVTQWFVLIDPDSLHAMTFAIARVTTAHTSLELEEASVRSFAADGTIWLTTDRRDLRPRPAEMKTERLTGPPERILAAHLERVKDVPLETAEFPDGWIRRIEREQARRHEVLEVAGVYGPTREELVSLPGDRGQSDPPA